MTANAQQTSPDAPAQCEILFELYKDDSSVHLGRLLKGHNAGRLVSLRHIDGAPSEDLAPRVDLARSIAHPSLAKLLGIVRAGGKSYLASEYIPGVTLLELRRAVFARQSPLALNAAIRIVVDALNAAAVGQQLLHRAAGEPVHHLYADHIHVAAYGETLLSEVGVAPYLRPESTRRQQDDLRTAARELCWLVAGSDDPGSFAFQQCLPKPLHGVLVRALSIPRVSFPNTAAFVAELVAESGASLASEDVIRGELTRLVGPTLQGRQGKLALLERGAAQQDWDESTQSFRSSQFARTDGRDTARPPAIPGAVSVPPSPPLAVLPPIPRSPSVLPLLVGVMGDDEDEDATRMWRSGVAAPPSARESGPVATVAEPSSRTPQPLALADITQSRAPLSAASDDTALARFRNPNTAGWLLAIAVALGAAALLANHFGF